MANRLDFYFKQKVTEAELDEAFDHLETAQFNLMKDAGTYGVFSGLAVTAQASPDLTVQVSIGTGYDKAGERLRVPSAQTVNLAVDFNAVTTAVSGAGNSKYISLFLMFDRNLTDPRTDGNSTTVFFERAESYSFHVVQGAEAVSPSKPALDSAGILLCDVLRVYGGTTIINGAIEQTTRREDAYVATGSPRAIRKGTVKAAIQDIVTFYNNHVGGGTDRHPATAIDYAGGAAWADGVTNPAATVEAQLDLIITRLVSTTSSVSGVRKLGGETQTSGAYTLPGGTLFAQLTYLLAGLDALNTAVVKLAGTQTITGTKTFSAAPTFSIAGAWPGLDTRTLTDWQVPHNVTLDDTWTSSSWGYGRIDQNAGVALFEIFPPPGMVITGVKVIAAGETTGSLPATMPAVAFARYTPGALVVVPDDVIGGVSDPSANNAAYTVVHAIPLTGLSHTVNPLSRYVVKYTGASGSAGDRITYLYRVMISGTVSFLRTV